MDDRTTWRTYYTEKRVGQQWKQLDLLSALPVQRVLEVGPHRGFVTALLDNMGYEATTLDIGRPFFERPKVPHLGGRPEDALAGDGLRLRCDPLL